VLHNVGLAVNNVRVAKHWIVAVAAATATVLFIITPKQQTVDKIIQ